MLIRGDDTTYNLTLYKSSTKWLLCQHLCYRVSCDCRQSSLSLSLILLFSVKLKNLPLYLSYRKISQHNSLAASGSGQWTSLSFSSFFLPQKRKSMFLIYLLKSYFEVFNFCYLCLFIKRNMHILTSWQILFHFFLRKKYTNF